MGTDKRNRQKENRRARQGELEKQIQRQKVVRRGVRIAVLVGVVVIIVAAINLWPDGDDIQTQETTETSITETLETTPAPAPAGPFEYGQGECAPADGSGEQIQKFTAPPKLCIDLAKTYTALVSTNKGDVTLVLDPTKAPGTVNNFVNLARSKYFDGTVCHRAIPSFVVQCGDQLPQVLAGRAIRSPMNFRQRANTNLAHWRWLIRGQIQTAASSLLFRANRA